MVHGGIAITGFFLVVFLISLLKCSDIKGAFLVERTIYITVNNVSQPVQYLTITLISHKGIQTLAETSMEAGRALLEMLQEKNPQIDTKNGIVIKEKEYNKYCKEIRSSHT